MKTEYIISSLGTRESKWSSATKGHQHRKNLSRQRLLASFETMIGLRQGDSLSTLLFNLWMEKI